VSRRAPARGQLCQKPARPCFGARSAPHLPPEWGVRTLSKPLDHGSQARFCTFPDVLGDRGNGLFGFDADAIERLIGSCGQSLRHRGIDVLGDSGDPCRFGVLMQLVFREMILLRLCRHLAEPMCATSTFVM
jgi:hypothetical protein